MPSEQAGSLYPLIMMAVVFAFFYFFAIRPQKKKEKEIAAMRDSIRIGDRIITIGGIKAKVLKVGEEYLTIETSNQRTVLDVTRWSVGSIEDKNIVEPVSETKDYEDDIVVEEDILLEDDSVTEDEGI